MWKWSDLGIFGILLSSCVLRPYHGRNTRGEERRGEERRGFPSRYFYLFDGAAGPGLTPGWLAGCLMFSIRDPLIIIQFPVANVGVGATWLSDKLDLTD